MILSYDNLFTIGTMTGCHQLPERSFFFKGKQFPVCARCTGAFIGYFIGGITYRFFSVNIIVSLLFCLIMFLDWLIQYIKLCESNNIRRLITGTLCGYGLIQISLDILAYLMNLITS